MDTHKERTDKIKWMDDIRIDQQKENDNDNILNIVYDN